MKLNLIFIVMDLLILFVYPFVFVHGKLLRFSKPKERICLPNVLATVPVIQER